MDERVPILYEDNHLLVVVKRPGLPAQRDESGDTDLLTLLKAYVGEKYQKPGAVYLGLVHRLDRPVGGLMVVARTSKAAARLSQQIRERCFDKRYLAVLQGEVSRQMELSDWLLKDERSGMVSVVPEGTPGAKLAQLVSTPRATAADDITGDAYTLLDIRLITGRAHQIRVQHASAGYPIAGDRRYGPGAARGSKPQSIALWASGLGFLHPTTRAPLRFFAPPDMRGFWRMYKDTIATIALEESHE